MRSKLSRWLLTFDIRVMQAASKYLEYADRTEVSKTLVSLKSLFKNLRYFLTLHMAELH